MTNVCCPICHGLGWVCENHANRPWTDTPDGCQCGAVMPCNCNRAVGDDIPDVEGIIEEAEGNPRTTRH